MAVEARKIGNVEGLGDIYQAVGPLDAQIQAFQDVGIQAPFLVAPEEVVDIRLTGLSNDFSRTNMAPIALKGENTVLYRFSPLMNPLMVKLAVSSHRNGKYFEMPKDVYGEVREIVKAEEGKEPEDRTALLISQREDFVLTPEMPETRFILGSGAGEYFKRFNHKGIQFYNLSGDSKNKSVVNYLWFDAPEGGSGLGAGDGSLGGGYGAFGVLVTGEASAKNLRYRLSEIRKANSEIIPVVLEQEHLSRLTDIITKPLTKGLLERLRKGN